MKQKNGNTYVFLGICEHSSEHPRQLKKAHPSSVESNKRI